MSYGAGGVTSDLASAQGLILLDEHEKDLAFGMLNGVLEPIAHMVREARARVERMSCSEVQQGPGSNQQCPPKMALLRQIRLLPSAGLGRLESMVEAALINIRRKRLRPQHVNPGAGRPGEGSHTLHLPESLSLGYAQRLAV